MKMKKIINIILLLIVVSCSSKKTEKQIATKPQLLTIDAYEPASVCDCSDDGIKALNDILDIRQRYENTEGFNKDAIAVQNVSLLKENWVLIRNKCLQKFASKLFNLSECNDPSKIGELREKLNSLGLSTA